MAFRRAFLKVEFSRFRSGWMASASRAAYFPVSHQHQVFLKGSVPTSSHSPVSSSLQPAQCRGGASATRVPSFTPRQALALCLQPRPGPTSSLLKLVSNHSFMWQIFLEQLFCSRPTIRHILLDFTALTV